jgi:hypothetical protein
MISWWQRLTDLTVGLPNQPTNQSNNSILPSPPSQATSLSASHEIPHSLWQQKVHSHVHSTSPLLPILHHINPVHALPSYFFQAAQWSLPFRLPHQKRIEAQFHEMLHIGSIYVCCITWDDFTRVKTNWRRCLPCNKTKQSVTNCLFLLCHTVTDHLYRRITKPNW